MKIILIIPLLITCCFAVDMLDLMQEEWHSFKLQHNKTYGTNIEDKYRMKVYLDNRYFIARHNARYAEGLVSFKLSLNKYADEIRTEFVKTRNGFRQSPQSIDAVRGASFIAPANVKIPDAVDWRDDNAVTPVKDQGKCGSCWAFSATGSLEGQHFRKTGRLVSLSEQNLVDCANWWYLNFGCNGGEVNHAFRYVKKYGLDTEESYPYEAKNDKCHYKPQDIGTNEVSWASIKRGHEEDLKAAVATVGPVSIAIDASLRSFHFYSEGIYDDSECSTHLDHAVLIVGYGSENGKDYWLVKNSWGESWGEQGYIKIARNKNMCGIANSASYPIL